MSRPLVYVVVLNWNGWRDTIACVESCRNLTWPNLRVAVVDNGSTDGSEEILRQRLQDVEIIQSGANLGFAGGNNVGIRRALLAEADYVWLLNNDTEVAPEALTGLVKALETSPRAGFAGSKIYLHGEPGRLGCVGGLWEKGHLRLRMLGANQLDRGQFDEPAERGSVSGCSLLVRSRTVQDIGLMDESYFLYWEDTEWCARAKEKGYTILYEPTSHVYHKVSASAGKGSLAQYSYFVRNGFYFLRRYDPLLLPVFAVVNLLFAAGSLAGGHWPPARGFLRGTAAFFRGEVGPMRL